MGASGADIADEDLPETMDRLGRAMHLMASGVREILMSRTAMKGEFRMAQTVIRPTGNNPLKFSVTEEQAVEALAKPPAKGYLGTEAAIGEAINDLKAHEVAMLTGMQAALKGLLEQLDPKNFVAEMEKRGGRGSFFKAKKSQYWEIYEDAYAEIAAEAEDDFKKLFENVFASAYQDQLEKLK